MLEIHQDTSETQENLVKTTANNGTMVDRLTNSNAHITLVLATSNAELAKVYTNTEALGKQLVVLRSDRRGRRRTGKAYCWVQGCTISEKHMTQ